MKTLLAPKLHALTISSLAIGGMLACFLAGAQCLPPPSGIVGWWPGDGNTTDIIGGNNGTLMNGAGFALGEVGSAFQLDGTNNDVQIPDSAALKPANVSVEVWLKLDSRNPADPTAGINKAVVFKKNNDSDPNRAAYALQFRPIDLRFGFLICGPSPTDSGRAAFTTYSTSDQVVTGRFYHVVGTYDQNAVRIYVNGVLRGQDFQTFQIDYGTSPVFIGATGLASNSDKFGGGIDEVTIYNRALSASEVAALYAAGSAGKCKTLPYITTPPQSHNGFWGESTSFSVTATTNYPPLSYQWLSNGVPVLNATNQTFSLYNLQSSFAAGYSVIVSNPNGSVTSSPPALLTFDAADTSISLYPGVLIKGVVGYTYGVQSSTNLADPNSWIGLTNLTLSTSNLIWYDSLQSSLSKKFYRVLQGPIPIP